MAKRARGSTSRPGQRPPLQRSGSRAVARPAAPAPDEAPPVLAPRTGELTKAEEARAAELEAAIVAEERRAEAATKRANAARTAPVEGPRSRAGLAVSAAEEYQYVARDVRRITIVGGAMFAILIAIWVVSQVTGFASL